MAENIKGQEQGQVKDSPHGNQHEGVVTVVLTADNHLGYAPFGHHPRKREERQERLRRTFQQAADFAVMQGVDLFIQAGDLFDSIRPDERDRSLVASRLAQLKQAGVKTFALSGLHDTPMADQTLRGEAALAPQMSYARLGALHYFPPIQKVGMQELEPVILTIDGIRIGICGLSVMPGQEGDPLANIRVQGDIEHTDISVLILHAPIEGLSQSTSTVDIRGQVSRTSLEKQTMFRYILAGYHHCYSHIRAGKCDVIVAGATQHIDFSTLDHAPGFVYLGIAPDGLRWCNHVEVDALKLRRLTVSAKELNLENRDTETSKNPTEIILDRLEPLCDRDTMVQLCLEGELARNQYHQLDLNLIRRYGEEHCFALTIDDSAISLLPEQETVITDTDERFSPREELIALVDEWIAASSEEQEKNALDYTREELLLAMDEVNGRL